jgi:hypothetical protein
MSAHIEAYVLHAISISWYVLLIIVLECIPYIVPYLVISYKCQAAILYSAVNNTKPYFCWRNNLKYLYHIIFYMFYRAELKPTARSSNAREVIFIELCYT